MRAMGREVWGRSGRKAVGGVYCIVMEREGNGTDDVVL